MRHLEDYPWYREYPGAGSIAFHRWLPDGEADALIVPLKRWRGELKLWVERFGYSDNHGFINFDQGRREIDEKSLKRQAVVFSGPLFGYLKMEILRADMEAVRRGTAQYEQHQRSHNAPDSFDYYSDFGKIVAGILGELLESFFDLIRFNYGQYWLEPFKRWDSRDRKLGSYFGSVLAKWSDDNAIWHDFRPTARQEVARVRPRPWDQFLTEQDWRDIGDALRRKIRPEPAGMMLARANRFLDEGEVATALVEGITALEIAISSFMAQRLNRSGIGEIGRFKDLPR